jgi:LEA14-like dessication related protein
MRRLARVLLPALLVATLPGCATLSRLLGQVLEKPKLAFDHASVKTLSLDGLTLDTVWRVDNPNGFGLDLSRLGYALSVDGHPVAKGDAPGGVHLPAKGTGMVTLPLSFRFQDLAGTLTDLMNRKTLPYRVSGRFGFDTPVGGVEIPFDHQGTVPVPRLPGVRIEGARIANLSLTGATVEVRLAVTNGNAFPLAIDRLAYAARVAGSQVGTGQLTPGRLPASGTRVLVLPLTVHFASAGRAVYDALRSGHLAVGVKGSLDAGAVHLPLDLARTVNLH